MHALQKSAPGDRAPERNSANEISFFAQCRRMCDLSRPPTKSSSMPFSSGIFLNGFLA